MKCKIVSTGYYVPKNILTNEMLEQIVDTNDEWITDRTGIKERRIVSDENTIDLAYNAALSALEDGNIDVNDIDLIVVATFSPENYTPSTASIVQAKLGLNGKHVMAFDVNAACTGFVYAMSVADALMQTGKYKKGLLIGAEVISKHVNWEDRNTCILFGDGAGAVVLEPTDKGGIIDTYCDSRGDIDCHLIVDGINIDNPFQKTERMPSFIHMNGREVFKFATNAVKDAITKILEDNDLEIADIDYVIPHQANFRIIDKVARMLKMDMDKFYINLDKYGNTSAASIPIALAEAMRLEKIKPGDKVIFVGFGGGLTYASALVEF